MVTLTGVGVGVGTEDAGSGELPLRKAGGWGVRSDAIEYADERVEAEFAVIRG